ncbi:MAG: DNA polymerase III subunit delta [Ruminococcus sp.]|nr:DNA polymerase III subunit delta [Ruminococcus sp.]
MAVVDCKSINAKIKQGDLAGAYYFYGADIVQVEDMTKKLVRKATDGNEDMALTKYDGKTLKIQELADASELFPMMSPYNCILINDFNGEKCNEEQLKQLLKICENLGEQTVLVFSITGFDVKDGRKSPTPKNKKLIDKISKIGTVCEAVQRTFPEIARSVISAAQKKGCIMGRGAADALVVRCVGNTVQIKSELEKLCMYSDGKEITESMIEELVAASVETTVFALAKSIISCRRLSAMEELDKLYAMRTERTFIVHAVATAFLDIYRACTAWRSSMAVHDMQKDFGYKFDFVVKNAFRDCRSIPIERIRVCILILRDLEQKLNSSAADERILMETALVKMLEIASGRMEYVYD